MSFQITDAMVNQYKSSVLQVYQQKASIFRGSVRERPVTGQSDFWDRIGKVAASKLTTRHGPTLQADTPHSRRMVTLQDYAVADYVDKADIIRILIDPKSEYVTSQAMALGRAFDDEVMAAFYAAANTGQSGGTSVAFSADWPVTRSSTQGDYDFSSAAMTVANLLTLKKAFDKNDVPPEGRHIVFDPSGATQLLSTTQVSSADYNTVKALAQGQLDTFAGFKFHTSNRVPLQGTTKYYGFAWHEDSMAVSVGMEMFNRVSEVPERNFSWLVYSAMSFGSARIQGEGVARFLIDTAL